MAEEHYDASFRSNVIGFSRGGDPTSRDVAQEQYLLTLNDRNKMIADLKAELAAKKLQNAQLEDRVNQLTEETLTDPLTGLKNRRFFDEELGRRFSELSRDSSRDMSLINIDLDNFKPVNDHGESLGDQILIYCADALSTPLRYLESVVRYGGDEFSIILPGVDIESAEKVATRVRNSLARACVIFDYDANQNILEELEIGDEFLYTFQSGKEGGPNLAVAKDGGIVARLRDSNIDEYVRITGSIGVGSYRSYIDNGGLDLALSRNATEEEREEMLRGSIGSFYKYVESGLKYSKDNGKDRITVVR